MTFSICVPSPAPWPLPPGLALLLRVSPLWGLMKRRVRQREYTPAAEDRA